MREIELELQIAASKETEVKGQAEGSGSIWSVVTAEVGGSVYSKPMRETLTVRLTLVPGLPEGLTDENPPPQRIERFAAYADDVDS